MRNDSRSTQNHLPLFEALEDRMMLSANAIGAAQPLAEGTLAAASIHGAAPATSRVALGTTRTTLSASTKTALLGQRIKLTAQVKSITSRRGTLQGTVQFLDGKTVLGTAAINSKGVATLSVYNLFNGRHTFSATYKAKSPFRSSHSTGVVTTIKQGPMTTKAGGLKVATTQAGHGAGAVAGQYLKVNYTGYLTNGTKFDSSLNPGRTPFVFKLGAGQVIKGWDQGMVGMKAGEQRVLIIPPSLGYGSSQQGSIPPNSTLIFIVQMIGYGVGPKLGVAGPGGTAIEYNQTPSAAVGTVFGPVAVGSSSSVLTYSLFSKGDSSLYLTNSPAIALSGANAGDFVVTQPANSGTGTIFTLKFTPTAAGERSATVTIYTNDAQHPAFSFTVQGTGQ